MDNLPVDLVEETLVFNVHKLVHIYWRVATVMTSLMVYRYQLAKSREFSENLDVHHISG